MIVGAGDTCRGARRVDRAGPDRVPRYALSATGISRHRWSPTLASRVSRYDLPPELPVLLTRALGLSEGAAPGTAVKLADQERSQLLGLLVHAAFGLAQDKPLVLLVEDLQWIDPSTLEMVQMVVEQAAEDRLLVLATARPEFHPSWPTLEHFAQAKPTDRRKARFAR